jgi:hypothetical protein
MEALPAMLMPYRQGMNWSEVIPRIGWLTWEDCLEALPTLRSELSPANMEELSGRDQNKEIFP